MINVLFNWKMAYNLKQITHNNEPIIIPLPEAEVIIGTNNVQLQTYPQMSEQHAKFYKIENCIAIRDLNSRYGTYVNGIRIGSDTMFLKHGDIIGFGVNTKSAENGFVCVLICEPFGESHNNRKQPVISVKKEPPEIIDISQDDDDDEIPKIVIDSGKTVNSTCLDFKTSDVQKSASSLCNENVKILIKEGWEHAKNFNSVPSTSKGHTSVKKRYPHTKKFFVPLVRCDSESFLWPPDVKNPFLFESEDEDTLSMRKKRPKRISSDLSIERSEEESSRSFLKKPQNNQNQFNNNGSKNSSIEHPDDWKNLSRRKKRARQISSDSSDESSVESNNSIYHKSKKSFLNQSKTENIPSSGFVALPESSSPDFSVKKLDKNISSNIAKLSTSNSALESLNRNFNLNSLSKSDMETDEYSSHKSNQLNIQKTEVRRKLFPIPDYSTNTRVMEYDLKKDSYHKQFNEIDSVSVAKEIINESDSVFGTDIVQNSIPLKTELEDSKNPESDNTNESNCVFDTNIVQNSIPIKTEPKDSKNPESDNINEPDSVFDTDTVQNSIRIKTEPEDSKNPESDNINESDSVLDTDIVQNPIPIKTELEDSKNPESDNIKEIFEGDDESEVLPSGALSKNSAFDNEETESVERIQQFVNCSAQKNSVESECEGNKELNPKLTNSESEMSLEDFLPSVKSLFRNSKFGDKKSSKSCGKTLLTDPKPMTYRPRKMRGRDEGYVERQKTLDLYPKKKRGRPRKEEQLQSEAMNSSGTKILDKCEECAVPLSNLKLTPVSKGKDTLEADPSGAKYAKSATKPFLNSKLAQKSFHPFAESEEGTSKKCLEVEHEVSNPHIQKQLSKIPEKCKEKFSANDHLKNKGLPSSTGTKDPRKNTKSTVKIRPEKFSSRSGFLTNGEEAKPVRRDKISGKSKKYEGASNAEKNDAPQTQFANKIRDDGQKENKVDERDIVPGNALSIKDNPFQDILHSSADASSTCTLPVKNLGNSNFQNIPHSVTDAPHRISMLTENIQLPFELSFNGMVKSLLKLNPVWLKEQCKNSQPPPQLMQDVGTLPLYFTSYESYAAKFYPLLKLKIWQCMFESSKKVLPNKKKRFNFRVLSFVNEPDYIELKCESVTNDKYCFEPREGNMTDLRMHLKTNKAYPLFGFISKHKVDTLNENLLHSCWKKTSAEYLKDAKRWIFHVWIKQKELLLEPDILMEGDCICYVRNDLNLVDALKNFKDSPLMTDILEPGLQTFALSCSKSSSSRKYTPRQSDIIQAICSEIYKPYLECKITLIHGPPGTGKTRIIIGILETLFYASKSNSNLKVLVTAPSNRAVDEIGCRLIELNKQYGLNNYAFKFVRVGVENTVHPKMLPYFIDQKAAEKHKERELQALRLKILDLEKEPNSLNKEKQLKSLNDHCKLINDNISLKTGDYKTDIKYKCDVLKESNIVLTTLSSCNLSLLCKTFSPTSKSDLNFSCCIVDESTQCSEIEILQPLAFGISKLILVGDGKQPLAAHLEYAKKYHFNRSMLDRFREYFRHSNQPSPVVYLTE